MVSPAGQERVASWVTGINSRFTEHMDLKPFDFAAARVSKDGIVGGDHTTSLAWHAATTIGCKSLAPQSSTTAVRHRVRAPVPRKQQIDYFTARTRHGSRCPRASGADTLHSLWWCPKLCEAPSAARTIELHKQNVCAWLRHQKAHSMRSAETYADAPQKKAKRHSPRIRSPRSAKHRPRQARRSTGRQLSLEWRRPRESLVVLRGVAEKAPLFFRLATILSKGLCGTLYPAMGMERPAAALIHLIRRGRGTIYFIRQYYDLQPLEQPVRPLHLLFAPFGHSR